MTPLSILTESLAGTRRLGHRLAAALPAGSVVALNGPLGAGKTTLVRSIAEALGCDEALVNSPTFTIVQEYSGTVPVFHIDAYRLKDSDEFLELGGPELLSAGGVCLIEWAERIADVLPRDLVRIDIVPVGAEARQFTITGLPELPDGN